MRFARLGAVGVRALTTAAPAVPTHASALAGVRASDSSSVPHHRQIFHAMDLNGDGTVSTDFLIGFLANNGLRRGDKRLAGFFAHLDGLGAGDGDVSLSLADFHEAIATCSTLVSNGITGDLRVPDFKSLSKIIARIYEDVLPNESGENATYIPQLASVDPDQFGISLTTVDGQHFSIGDDETQFCLQSCSKPLSYIMAIKEFGEEYVHKYVGTEPSGHRFDHMALKAAPTAEEPRRARPRGTPR